VLKLSEIDKLELAKKISGILEKHQEISFAYLHGSFNEQGSFADIDIAVYLNSLPQSPLAYELQMEADLMRELGRYPVDVRILNRAPLSFRYNVIREGKVLVVRDEDQRSTFQETTVTRYFDFAPYRDAYLKETLGLGV
jgi:uncharacterized protein